MSTTAATGSGHQRTRRLDTLLILWGVPLVWAAILTTGLIREGPQIPSDLMKLLPWAALLLFVNLLPVPGWASTHMTVDVPVAAASGLVLSPIEAGLVGFLTAFDLREFSRSIAWQKALFNRSQVGLLHYAGAQLVHALARNPAESRLILVLALAYIALTLCLNYLLVGTFISGERGFNFSHVIKRLRLGLLTDFTLTYLSWGALGAMLVALYRQIGWPALLAFVGPTLVSRQILMRSQMVMDTTKAYRSREKVLTRLERQIHDERTDERKLIAADLHDEVLQPLFKVTLMAHVLKADLASGRLLEIDSDLPELLLAAETASGTLRELIGDLRRSTIGGGDVSQALRRLTEDARLRSRAEIHAVINQVTLHPETQLLLYQVGKEALSNALAHSRAANIWMELEQDGDAVRLTVRDDGIGFDPTSDREGHYGIHIMRERAASVGGTIYVDSEPSNGSTLTLLLTSRSGPALK